MSDTRIPWSKPTVGDEELNEIIKSFKDNWLSMGPKVRRFEKKMAEYVNAPYAIAVSNGTVALDIALKAIGISPGDEVIVPALTYFATASSVSYQGAVPVFVDIDRETFNLSPRLIEPAITKKTKAILYIDYGGNPANYDEIKQVAEKYDLNIIQDAAQSLGSVYNGINMGAQAEISTMSFHMAKIMTCVEGGMVFTHDKELAKKVMCMRNQGESSKGKYDHVILGTNARMTDLNAGIGLAQFKKLPMLLEKRHQVAHLYNTLFFEKGIDVELVSADRENCKNSYFLYPVLVKNRDRLAVNLLKKYGIDTRICYSKPVYQQTVYKSSAYPCRAMECPVTEMVTSQIINLPIFAEMTNEMVVDVVDAVRAEILLF